jgi:hypothetical protein
MKKIFSSIIIFILGILIMKNIYADSSVNIKSTSSKEKIKDSVYPEGKKYITIDNVSSNDEVAKTSFASNDVSSTLIITNDSNNLNNQSNLNIQKISNNSVNLNRPNNSNISNNQENLENSISSIINSNDPNNQNNKSKTENNYLLLFCIIVIEIAFTIMTFIKYKKIEEDGKPHKILSKDARVFVTICCTVVISIQILGTMYSVYKVELTNESAKNLINLKYLPTINNIEIYKHYAISNFDEFINKI